MHHWDQGNGGATALLSWAAASFCLGGRLQQQPCPPLLVLVVLVTTTMVMLVLVMMLVMWSRLWQSL
jgi:hypothetical protein